MMKSAQNHGGGFFSEEDPLSSLWYPMVRHEEEIIIPEEARTNTEIAPRINAASEAQSSIAKQVGQALGGAALGVGKAAIGVFGQKAPGVTGRAVASPTITKTGKQALGFGKQILDFGIGVKQGLSKEGEL
jgi:hypothetical protein